MLESECVFEYGYVCVCEFLNECDCVCIYVDLISQCVYVCEFKSVCMYMDLSQCVYGY